MLGLLPALAPAGVAPSETTWNEPDPDFARIERGYGILMKAAYLGKGREPWGLATSDLTVRAGTETLRSRDAARTVFDRGSGFARLLVARIARTSANSVETVVGYVRTGAAVVYDRDLWRRTDGEWRLALREEDSPSPRRFEHALVGDVLRALAGTTNLEWEIEPAADRRIAVNLDGLSFSSALPLVLGAAKDRARIDEGVVHIAPAERIELDAGNVLLSKVEFEETDVRDAVRRLFRRVGLSYTIDPGLRGSVDTHLVDVTWETALQEVLRQAGAAYRCDGGVFQVFRREDADLSVKPR